MTEDSEQDGTSASAIPAPAARPELSPAARRALDEAAARKREAAAAELPTEHGGRKGPEPTRFGDWEKKGIISDF